MPRRLFLVVVAVTICAPAASAQDAQWTQKRPLPRPTGSHAVGTQRFDMQDTVTFPDGRRVARPVTTQVWYPARTTGQNPPAHYVEDRALLDSMIEGKYQDLPAEDLRPWGDLRLSAATGADPSRASGRRGWPVLVLSHGFGVSRVSYAGLALELASRGYVVLTVDHPYGGFMLAPDGKLLQPGGDSLLRRLGSPAAPASVDSALAWDTRRWAIEGAAAVRQLASRRTNQLALGALAVDTLRVGMLGHSLGGAAALQACRDDAIFRACADMDGSAVGDVERSGVPRPFLVLLSEPGGSHAEPKDSAERAHRAEFARMGRERDSTWRAIRERHPEVPAFIVKLRGTAHLSFSDAPFLMPSLLQGTGSTLPAEDAAKLIVDLLVDFFDHFLRGASLRRLHTGSTTVP